MSRVRRSAVCVAPILIAGLFILSGLFTARAARAAADVGSVNFTLGYKSLTSKVVVAGVERYHWELAASDTLEPSPPSQPGLGVELTWGRRGWPVSLALDLHHSYDDGLQRYPFVNLGADTILASDVRRRASTLEISLGLRRSFNLKAWEPYVGGGGSWVHANVIHEMSDPTLSTVGALISSETGHDSAFGYWFGGGLLKRFGPRFHIGLTARYSSAKLELPSREVVGEAPSYHFVTFVPSFPGERPPTVDAGGRHIGLVLGWDFPAR